jgi:multiple sugar transport system substrate-binding protein
MKINLDKRIARRVHHKVKPEGPYETQDQVNRPRVSHTELSSVIDFVEQFHNELNMSFSTKSGYNEVPMLCTLMKNHLHGKLTTTTSLVANSGMTYGTAMRALEGIETRSLVLRRPRTSTGKSYSLHPSEKLMTEWQELSRRLTSLVGARKHSSSKDKLMENEYFFGSSYANSQVLAPPSPLTTKLPINKGLRRLVHADPTFMAMNALKKQFESIFGVDIHSRALSIDRLREEILDNSKQAQSRYDLIACDLPWFGEMAEGGHFLCIDELISQSNFDTSDFHSEAIASTRYLGKSYGIPVQTSAEILFYRQDLFERLELEKPQTADDVLKCAEAIHNRLGGVSGIAWNAARGTPLGHSFLYMMGAFGQPILNLNKSKNGFDAENIFDQNFRPMFNTPIAREVAIYLKMLVNYSPRGILNMSWYERTRCYADGEVGIAFAATLLAPLFELDINSPAHNCTEYLPIPPGPSGRAIAHVGGYALSIPSNVPKDRLSSIWTALVSLTSPETIKLYIENGSLVTPRFSTGRDPDVQKISPLISLVDEMATKGILKMWARPPVPELSIIIAIAGEEIHDFLSGKKTLENALNDAQNRADLLMQNNGHY